MLRKQKTKKQSSWHDTALFLLDVNKQKSVKLNASAALCVMFVRPKYNNKTDPNGLFISLMIILIRGLVEELIYTNSPSKVRL